MALGRIFLLRKVLSKFALTNSRVLPSKTLSQGEECIFNDKDEQENQQNSKHDQNDDNVLRKECGIVASSEYRRVGSRTNQIFFEIVSIVEMLDEI